MYKFLCVQIYIKIYILQSSLLVFLNKSMEGEIAFYNLNQFKILRL